MPESIRTKSDPQHTISTWNLLNILYFQSISSKQIQLLPKPCYRYDSPVLNSAFQCWTSINWNWNAPKYGEEIPRHRPSLEVCMCISMQTRHNRGSVKFPFLCLTSHSYRRLTFPGTRQFVQFVCSPLLLWHWPMKILWFDLPSLIVEPFPSQQSKQFQRTFPNIADLSKLPEMCGFKSWWQYGS